MNPYATLNPFVYLPSFVKFRAWAYVSALGIIIHLMVFGWLYHNHLPVVSKIPFFWNGAWYDIALPHSLWISSWWDLLAWPVGIALWMMSWTRIMESLEDFFITTAFSFSVCILSFAAISVTSVCSRFVASHLWDIIFCDCLTMFVVTCVIFACYQKWKGSIVFIQAVCTMVWLLASLVYGIIPGLIIDGATFMSTWTIVALVQIIKDARQANHPHITPLPPPPDILIKTSTGTGS